MIDYSKEDFLTPEPYEAILSIASPFEREVAINQMADYAKRVGISTTGFKKMLKSYVESKQKAENTIYLENVTAFTGQPLELDCGEWRADDMGVSHKTGMGEEIACCHPIMPVERLVNIDTGGEKLRIAYSKGRRWREAIIDKKILASNNSIVQLAEMGIAVTSENARALVRYISEMENINYDRIPERKSVGRLGYIEGEGFSPYVDGLIFDGDANFQAIFSSIRQSGSFSRWLEVAKECRTMSTTARIFLASSFASVLVGPLGGLPFFVHLWGGESGTGKTVALMLAASVWGDPRIGRYIQTFNATTVGHEKTAAFLNSLPMLVDELQLAKDARGRLNFNVYSLAQGVGRTRGTRLGGLEKTPTWANCILTTGESPLTTSGDGAGALNRVIDIECRQQEQVISDGMRISGELKRNFGHAGRQFVRSLYAPGNMEQVQRLYQEAFRSLSERDTTEKQAMAAAMIVVADALATLWIFRDDRALTLREVSEFLQSKAAVSAGERGYRYICDWAAQNATRLRPDVENGDTYGVIDGDWVWVIRSVFNRAAEDGGFSPAALLSFLKGRGLIYTRGRNNTRGRRIGGVLTECVVIRLSPPEEEECENTDNPLI